MTYTLTPTTKKRGGQPGNKNAQRHGLYSKHFTASESELLDVSDEHLQDEIMMLRVAISRLFSLRPKASLDDAITILSTLSKASSSLARILKIQHDLDLQEARSTNSEFSLAVSQAISELTRDWNLDK